MHMVISLLENRLDWTIMIKLLSLSVYQCQIDTRPVEFIIKNIPKTRGEINQVLVTTYYCM